MGFTHIEQWIDEPFGREGKDLLNKIGETIDRHCDEDAEIDGVIFCFAGHGLATKFKGQDGETFCAYDAVLEKLNIGRLHGMPKLVVWDCCLFKVIGPAPR